MPAQVWRGSYALARYCAAHSDLCSGRSVLELGSGTGLLGLWLSSNDQAAAAGPKRVLLTDVPAMLPLLRKNLSHNKSRLCCDVSCEVLDWTVPLSEAITKALPCDVIVAADVLYEPEFVAPLLSTLLASARTDTCVIMALSHRVPELEAEFFGTAAPHFDTVDVTRQSPDAEMLISGSVSIFRLSRKPWRDDDT